MPRSRISHFALLWTGIVAVAVSSPQSRGDDAPVGPNPATGPEAAVAAALGHEIIGPRQTLADTKAYAAGLVPSMPEVKTLEEWKAFADRTRAEVLRRVIFRGQAAA